MPDDADQPTPVDIPIPLRWGDMDVNAHINNVQFARLFEEARVRSIAAMFSDVGAHPPGVVVSQTIDFRAQLEYGFDPVTVRVVISDVGRSSYVMACTLTGADGRVYAVAETTMVMLDPDDGRPMPIPDPVRDVLAAHRGASAGLHGQRG